MNEASAFWLCSNNLAMEKRKSFSCRLRLVKSLFRSAGIMPDTAFRALSGMTVSRLSASACLPARQRSSIAKRAFPFSEKAISAIRATVPSDTVKGLKAMEILSLRMSMSCCFEYLRRFMMLVWRVLFVLASSCSIDFRSRRMHIRESLCGLFCLISCNLVSL